MNPSLSSVSTKASVHPGLDRLEILRQLERKILWLSTWMIHHANHLRPHRDGMKVGGHQASSASVVTLMTALYFDVLRPQDRVAVKPHASPVFHAIQYLLGRQTRTSLEQFRAFGGAQSYPSRTKDCDDVDFSTGSVGLGVGMTIFASLVQDYLRLKEMIGDESPVARCVALAGDAELDEGNVFESMFEGWKRDVRNVWWVIDYNRQSLDSIVEDRLFNHIDNLFRTMGWNVRILKYGKDLQRAIQQPGGDALRQWIDDCPNSLYSALVFKGGSAWRQRLLGDLGDVSGIRSLLDEHDDDCLQALMTNLAGHDMESVLESFHEVTDDVPTCFIAYTIKGYGLPFAGHKDNHAGLLSPQQMGQFQRSMGVADGEEWAPFAGLDLPEEHLQSFLASTPFAQSSHQPHVAPPVALPASLEAPKGRQMSTQAGFGRLLNDLAATSSELAERVVTASPDVTVSTGLGAWVNRRGIFDRRSRHDMFRNEGVKSPQEWSMSPQGQHIELGISENNLFVLMAALGLSSPLFGQRLFPIGTLYDPFIRRGLDALNYACYQGARFILVGTPSGITLAPEGGAHQSILSPLLGIGQPGLTYFEPAFADELAAILGWSFQHLQDDDGGSVYLRLSTRSIDQPQRNMTAALRDAILDGAYWLVPPDPGSELAIVCSGAVMPEAIETRRQIRDDFPGAGLLAVTSADRLHAGWLAASRARQGPAGPTVRAPIEHLLEVLSPRATLLTLLDGHPLTLSWLGSILRHRVIPMGIERFGQSGDLPDLYHEYQVDQQALINALASACQDDL